MKKWKCSVCGYIYDESKENIPFEKLPEDWRCPQCGVCSLAPEFSLDKLFYCETGAEE